jgi:hypothetical protein
MQVVTERIGFSYNMVTTNIYFMVYAETVFMTNSLDL